MCQEATAFRAPERGSAMSVYRIGDVYHYRFMLNRKLIRKSTKQSSKKEAEAQEAKHTSKLASEGDGRADAAERFSVQLKEVVRCPECEKWFDGSRPSIASDNKKLCGNLCRERWERRIHPVPTIESFAKEFLIWVDTQFREKPRTVEYYHNGVQNLLRYPPLASLSLDDRQVPERLTGYIQKRQSEGREVSTINRELAALRRLLHIAQRWGRIESVTKFRMLPGERNRERVVTPAEEARYLAAADHC
jgi:hypothetical protein